MRVLQVHNFYQQPGGEDQVYAAEHDLLTVHGNVVKQYSVHNDSLQGISGFRMGSRALWNGETYRAVRELIESESIELVHAHNTFPIISPSVYYAAHAARVPVVQTLHNYRLLCPGGTFFRDRGVCEQCLRSRVPYQAVVHRCYRASLTASATVVAMLASHHAARTWHSKVDAYIALTTFAKGKFVEGGLPADRIHVKPAFLASDPGFFSGAANGAGRYALFIGRLTEEKGIQVLCRAWQKLAKGIPLKVIGDGPLKSSVESLPGVDYLGQCDRSRVLDLLKQAAFLVVPSLWYEGFPMVIVEALACGTPIIASALGSMNEIIQDGVNGFRFAPGDAGALIGCVENALRGDGLTRMRVTVRACYEQNYTAVRNYDILMKIYLDAVQRLREPTNGPAPALRSSS